ncbi:MAG TPA: D-alanine--D-alanine ligase [Candidatus Kapabacteria bacterium]
MKVAIIYNEPKHTEADDHWLTRSRGESALEEGFRDGSEFGVLDEMKLIASELEAAGYAVILFSVNDDVRRLIAFLNDEKPDVIFNLCESVMGKSSLEMCVAGIYELYDIPYTGASAVALGNALNKWIAKSLFVAHKIPTPKFLYISEGEELPQRLSMHYPLIVKPASEDASIGIDNNSIVKTKKELKTRVEFVHREFKQAALIEEYIDGRELNVALLASAGGELEALPISEITFDTMPAGNPRIVSYEAKWVEDSPLYHTTVPVCPAKIDKQTAQRAREIALQAASVVGLRDYGRVDMRMRESDNALFVLEANPNPDISHDAGFMRAARTSGRTHEETIVEILAQAARRKISS